MKIFFGDANPKDYPGIEVTSLFCDPVSRKYYFYKIETDEDGAVRIMDTCNRMVPFDVTQIEALSDAVYVLREIEEIKHHVAQEVQDSIDDVVKTTHEYTGVRVLA